LCEHPELTPIDPVLGSLFAFPRQERAASGRCGPEGKRFKLKRTLTDVLLGRNK
jgi:hypothetical protein